MQVIKKENEAIVQAVREVLSDLEAALTKLDAVLNSKITYCESAYMVAFAMEVIQAAEGYLTKEEGEEEGFLLKKWPDYAYEISQIEGKPGMQGLEFKRERVNKF